jgi:hypothetical protein
MGQAIFSLRRSSSRMLEALRAEDSIHPKHVPIVQPLRFVQNVQPLCSVQDITGQRRFQAFQSFNR